MSEEQVVRHCAPTLAGLKTGSMFGAWYPNARALREDLRRWNQRLAGKGVCFLPLRYENSRALIYVYRPSRLRGDLGHRAAAELLGRCGYAPGSPAWCLCQLRCRMAQSEGFPHEVGLFLGYPPEDVRGFMECRAKGFRCVGCWKVYGDAEKAQKLFASYKKCTAVYTARHAKGTPVERLTVAG